jgi:hypothetical protein
VHFSGEVSCTAQSCGGYIATIPEPFRANNQTRLFPVTMRNESDEYGTATIVVAGGTALALTRTFANGEAMFLDAMSYSTLLDDEFVCGRGAGGVEAAGC